MGYGQYSYNSRMPRSHNLDCVKPDGTRAKKVHDNSMVAHLWANQSQSAAQSANGNFYFEGRVLWSYGTHFACGVIALGKSGERHVFLTTDRHSVTTSAHMSDAIRALNYTGYHSVPALTEIADALAWLSDGNAAHRPAIERYVKNHARVLDVPAIKALYDVAGIPSSLASLTRMKERADKAHALATGKAERDARAALLAKATKVAGWKPGYLADVLRTIQPHVLRTQIKELRTIHKAASAAGRTAQKAKIWSVIKRCVSELELVERREAVRNRRASLRNELARFRAYVDQHKAGELKAYGYQQLASAARLLALLPRVGKARATLLDTSAAATAEHARLMPLEAEAARIAREKAIADKAARDQLARDEWFRGIGRMHFSTPQDTAYVRATYVKRDDTGAIVDGALETSHGVHVPLLDAIKVFRMVKLCRERGKGWTRNGAVLPVGSFAVDWISEEGNFKAGCHRINWPEIARLAGQLGLADIEPADTTNPADIEPADTTNRAGA